MRGGSVELVGVAASDGWDHIGQEAEGKPWHRTPVACWALVRDDPASASYVVPMVPYGDHLEMSRPGGFLVHRSEQRSCRCESPKVEELDARFCTVCAGRVGDDA